MCVCGCGNKTVTPLTPTDWKLIFNGKSVSLDPSIGNWGFPCESHYWITNNKIIWATKWTKEQIIEGRKHSKKEKEKYYRENLTNKLHTSTKSKTPWWKFSWLFKNRSKT
ncbi:DUF6527 family protein [Muricauda sp. MAR_2010_75]|uniref:DUF6527 family protein n=1 Tax=Allomuricauda sp. MAR_2010_75 TaxID=1250232 RepID=UPI00373AF514